MIVAPGNLYNGTRIRPYEYAYGIPYDRNSFYFLTFDPKSIIFAPNINGIAVSSSYSP